MCKGICQECPFKRDSPPGYLGGSSGEPLGFIAGPWYGDVRIPCHMTVDWEDSNWEALAQAAPTCKGFATLCANSCKMPIDPMDAEATRETKPDRETVFANVGEFIEHHGGDPYQLIEWMAISMRELAKPTRNKESGE